MTIELIAHYAIAFCVITGAIFILVGAIGLMKFSDPMARLHAPTKVGTLGVGALLLGSMIHSDIFGEGWSMHEVLIMAFLFVTAPISANFMAKVSLHIRSCEAPPEPTDDNNWSTLHTDAEQEQKSELMEKM